MSYLAARGASLHHLALAREGRPTAVCLAIHETSGEEHFAKYDDVLNYIDKYVRADGAPGVGDKHIIEGLRADKRRPQFLMRDKTRSIADGCTDSPNTLITKIRAPMTYTISLSEQPLTH